MSTPNAPHFPGGGFRVLPSVRPSTDRAHRLQPSAPSSPMAVRIELAVPAARLSEGLTICAALVQDGLVNSVEIVADE